MIVQYAKFHVNPNFKSDISDFIGRQIDYIDLANAGTQIPSPFEYILEPIGAPILVNDASSVYSALARLQKKLQAESSDIACGFAVFDDESAMKNAKGMNAYWIQPSSGYSILSKYVLNQFSLKYELPIQVINISPATTSMFDKYLYIVKSRHSLFSFLYSRVIVPILDFQQNSIYKLPLPAFTNLGYQESLLFIKNVLSTIGLPMPLMIVKKTGDACSFDSKIAIYKNDIDPILADQMFTGKTPVQPHNPVILRMKKNSDAYDEYLSMQSQPSISSMTFTFNFAWGLNFATILHELAHFVKFFLPTAYFFNEGPKRLSPIEYTVLFSSHGVLYASVFLYLIKISKKYNIEEVKRSFVDSSIQFEELEDLSEKSIHRAIESFCSRFENSDLKMILLGEYMEILEEHPLALIPFFSRPAK